MCRPSRRGTPKTLGQGDQPFAVVQQPGVAAPHAIGLRGGLFPFSIDEFRGIQPCLLLPREAAIRPRLVRMAGEEQALVDAKLTVVGRQRVRGGVEVLGGNHDVTGRRE